MMRRRELITLLGGAAVAWPLAARAQQVERVRRVGVLMLTPDDAVAQARLTRFLQRLQELGWTEGRNLHVDVRWVAWVDALGIRQAAAELVALAPDVILANGSPTTGPLLQATRTIPIVFVQVVDPVGAGFIKQLARPGGNATGFSSFEYETSGKWLELLNQIAPKVRRVAVLRDPTVASGIGQLAAIQTAAASVTVKLMPITLAHDQEIEHAIGAFAHEPDGGMIVTAGGAGAVHRKLLIDLAARHRLPAVYPHRVFVADGGLIGYGPDRLDQYPRAASYVDRILKGEKPGDLPVQAPTKYEIAINLKTAKAASKFRRRCSPALTR
jgi:putative ABC transport system substrate-binding protein